ncbi:hypothetical protein E2C01_042345 [Portunus trituberculatus]|uniref:Uncharacterized protein n=1 Tax=Portunus trituberculatus TaxID=210409 RepID=A0A5B7FTF4_PORTR|nr:hypothetical protein [Portunus trituberculatus]
MKTTFIKVCTGKQGLSKRVCASRWTTFDFMQRFNERKLSGAQYNEKQSEVAAVAAACMHKSVARQQGVALSSLLWRVYNLFPGRRNIDFRSSGPRPQRRGGHALNHTAIGAEVTGVQPWVEVGDRGGEEKCDDERRRGKLRERE